MKIKTKLVLIAVTAALILLIVYIAKNSAQAGPYEGFAKCLAEKDAVMYGATWCPACQAQKKEFQGAAGLLSYVECPQDPQKCLADGIEAYPTWIFSSGEKLVGKQSLETLAEKTSCPLPQ